MYRKPNGEYAEDVKEMAKAWRDLAAPIEKATGWVLYGFSPGLSFHSPNGRQTVQIPVQFAHALSEALLEKGETK